MIRDPRNHLCTIRSSTHVLGAPHPSRRRQSAANLSKLQPEEHVVVVVQRLLHLVAREAVDERAREIDPRGGRVERVLRRVVAGVAAPLRT